MTAHSNHNWKYLTTLREKQNENKRDCDRAIAKFKKENDNFKVEELTCQYIYNFKGKIGSIVNDIREMVRTKSTVMEEDIVTRVKLAFISV